ncbi:MAG: hypothetical protein MR828_10030, partial [Clostridiales bacterium]|nr:hypothetical protein [Clostridiales bacterium]
RYPHPFANPYISSIFVQNRFKTPVLLDTKLGFLDGLMPTPFGWAFSSYQKRGRKIPPPDSFL